MISSWPEEVLSGVIGMHGFLLGSEEDSISCRYHGANGDDLVDALVFFRLQNRFRKHGVNWELSHSPA